MCLAVLSKEIQVRLNPCPDQHCKPVMNCDVKICKNRMDFTLLSRKVRVSSRMEGQVNRNILKKFGNIGKSLPKIGVQFKKFYNAGGQLEHR